MCALALPVLAQQEASQFFTGANPRKLKFEPINTSAAMRSQSINRSFQQRSRGFATPNLGNHVRSMSLGTWPPKIPNVFIQQKNSFQPNPPKGWNIIDNILKPKK
jgi:hypothetical protein